MSQSQDTMCATGLTWVHAIHDSRVGKQLDNSIVAMFDTSFSQRIGQMCSARMCKKEKKKRWRRSNATITQFVIIAVVTIVCVCVSISILGYSVMVDNDSRICPMCKPRGHTEQCRRWTGPPHTKLAKLPVDCEENARICIRCYHDNVRPTIEVLVLLPNSINQHIMLVRYLHSLGEMASTRTHAHTNKPFVGQVWGYRLSYISFVPFD